MGCERRDLYHRRLGLTLRDLRANLDPTTFMRVRLLLCIVLFCCAGPREAKIEALEGGKELGSYRKKLLVGIRDGDILRVKLVFADSSSLLTMNMRFRIGVPTRLLNGHYHWRHGGGILEGSVRASSVTFLGGQSDLPNLGGVFRLLSPAGSALYKVTLPTSEVARPRESVPEELSRLGGTTGNVLMDLLSEIDYKGYGPF